MCNCACVIYYVICVHVGKVHDGDTGSMPHYVNLNVNGNGSEDVIVDVAIAEQYIICVTDDGRVYSWGKNTGGTIQVIPCT